MMSGLFSGHDVRAIWWYTACLIQLHTGEQQFIWLQCQCGYIIHLKTAAGDQAGCVLLIFSYC